MTAFDPSQFDKSTFDNTPFQINVTNKPWGSEIIFTPDTLPYAGKIIRVDAGKRLSLQAHDEKLETLCLVDGECNLIIDNGQGELATISMEKEKGYTVKVGQRHRLHAVTNATVFEVSLPEVGTTFRLEDDYKRPDETEDLRREDRKAM